MAYLHTRRYLINANSKEELVALVRRAYWPEDIETFLEDHKGVTHKDVTKLEDLDEITLTAWLATAQEGGNATETVLVYDEWFDNTHDDASAFFPPYHKREDDSSE